MKSNFKTYITIFGILVIFFLAMILFFGKDSLFGEKKEAILFIDHDTIWTYKNKKWSNITNQSMIKEYDWNTFQVYIDNKKIGSYSLWRDDRWYAFDKNKNAIQLDGDFLAYQANYGISVVGFEQKSISDKNPVNTVLTENSLSTSSKFTSSYQISFDIDQDGILEDFYGITNAFPLDFNPNSIFSFVFMVKDSKIYSIYSSVEPNQSFNGCKPYFSSFLDVDEDSNYEFILNCGMYSDATPIRRLYQFSKDEFKILVSNE